MCCILLNKYISKKVPKILYIFVPYIKIDLHNRKLVHI